MIKIHIISIFPEAFESYFSSSIIWRAIKNWHLEPIFYTLGDFSVKKFKHVDDNAYGMHGQVLSPEPLSRALEWVFSQIWHSVPVVYLTPGWDLLQQEGVEKYYEDLWQEFVIICWHYEWIDQRIIDLYVTHEVSIGEYVLSSGELSAMVFIDSLVRNIPWVLWNKDSLEEDSFSKKFDRQKEYPVYTRPREFMWLSVPDVLVSWNHKKIIEWKKDNLK